MQVMGHWLITTAPCRQVMALLALAQLWPMLCVRQLPRSSQTHVGTWSLLSSLRRRVCLHLFRCWARNDDVTTLDRCHTTQHGSAPHFMFVRQCQTCAFRQNEPSELCGRHLDRRALGCACWDRLSNRSTTARCTVVARPKGAPKRNPIFTKPIFEVFFRRGCVSPSTMHFSVECLARGWTVTEPLTPSLVRWVVAAWVCENMWSWVFVVRGSGHVCQTTLIVTNRLTGVGSHKCFRPCGNASASASHGRNIAWDNLEFDQPFVDNGRCGQVQDNSQPLATGTWAVVMGNWERYCSSSYTMIPSRNTGIVMRRVTSCVQV